jgi:cation transport regulator ChaC
VADHGRAGGATWVFGYGSLVDPQSLGNTLRRSVTIGVDFVEAELQGWGRRWNYGVGHVVGAWRTTDGRSVDDGVIVALGLVASESERTNGIVARVTPDELAFLDHRERDYDRVDVTERVVASVPLVGRDRVVTYVPRPSAIARYEAGRDAGRAGIRSTYWGMVDSAFAVLGPDRVNQYRSSTPDPDVPVVAMVDANPPSSVRFEASAGSGTAPHAPAARATRTDAHDCAGAG